MNDEEDLPPFGSGGDGFPPRRWIVGGILMILGLIVGIVYAIARRGR